jgi:CRP-like cAMP-binding protein
MLSVSLFQNDPGTAAFPAGHRFFDAGDRGEAMFVVLDGEVELELRGVTLEMVGPGGSFGEMAVIDKRERSASAVARTPVVVARVDRRRFLDLVKDVPEFAIEIMATIADRLRRTDRAINPVAG